MNTQPDMNALMQMFLSMFAPQVPILLVCLGALIVIFVKWKQAPRACLWALLGLGLRLLLCVAMPVVQTLVNYSRMQGQYTAQHMGMILTMLGFLWSGLAAVTYALLLVAIFVGRSKPAA